MPVKKSQKMDPKLVASKDKNESEVKYISKAFKIPVGVVRSAMKLAGKNGTPTRSRKVIYKYLRGLNFVIKTKKYG